MGTLSQLYMNIGMRYVGRPFIKSLGHLQLYNSMVKTDLFVLFSDVDNKQFLSHEKCKNEND